jgi:polar amino acid transport system substrate-binding protein
MQRHAAVLHVVVSLLLCSFNAQAQNLLFVAEDLPPIHFKNSQGNVDGFLVDVSKAVIAKTDLNAKFVIMPQARALESASQQQNVFMMSLLKSENRSANFQWIGDVYQTRAFLLGLKGRDDVTLTQLDDAKHFIVGTIRGYFSETYLRQNGFSDKYNLGLAVRYDHLWGMLFKGHVDLVLTNTLSQTREITRAGYAPDQVQRYLALPDLTRDLHIATGLKTSKEVVTALADALKKVKTEGTFLALENKWRIAHPVP